MVQSNNDYNRAADKRYHYNKNKPPIQVPIEEEYEDEEELEEEEESVDEYDPPVPVPKPINNPHLRQFPPRDRNTGTRWDQFTDQEYRILQVLKDGKAHIRDDLMEVLSKRTSNTLVLNNHIDRIRQKVRMLGFDIVCTILHRKYHYKWVRSLGVLTDEF